MAVTDSVVMLALSLALNYGLIYQKNHFFGNIVFIALGASTWYILPEQPWGIILVCIALMNTVYDSLIK